MKHRPSVSCNFFYFLAVDQKTLNLGPESWTVYRTHFTGFFGGSSLFIALRVALNSELGRAASPGCFRQALHYPLGEFTVAFFGLFFVSFLNVSFIMHHDVFQPLLPSQPTSECPEKCAEWTKILPMGSNLQTQDPS